MQKIAIVGSSGSGKSHLATRIAQRLDLPLYHLDCWYWQPGWVPTERSRWHRFQTQLCQTPEWIIDGNYPASWDIRLNACDTVIFLDRDPLLCIFRVLKRTLKHCRRRRVDMALGCEERVDRKFLKAIWDFPDTQKPKLLAKFALHAQQKLIVLRTDQEVECLLARL